MRKGTTADVRAIVARNRAAGGLFFDDSHVNALRDPPGNYDVYHFGPATLLHNARGPDGLRDSWRRVMSDGRIGPRMRELDGLTPERAAALLSVGEDAP